MTRGMPTASTATRFGSNETRPLSSVTYAPIGIAQPPPPRPRRDRSPASHRDRRCRRHHPRRTRSRRARRAEHPCRRPARCRRKRHSLRMTSPNRRSSPRGSCGVRYARCVPIGRGSGAAPPSEMTDTEQRQIPKRRTRSGGRFRNDGDTERGSPNCAGFGPNRRTVSVISQIRPGTFPSFRKLGPGTVPSFRNGGGSARMGRVS